MYLLKLAVRPWRLAPLSQVFSSIAAGVLIFLIGFLFWMQQGLNPVIAKLQNEHLLTAYLDASVEPAKEQELVERVRSVVAASQPEIRFVGAADFVAHIRSQFPALGEELDTLGAESSQVVPRSISIIGALTDEQIAQIKATAGIESVENSRDRYQNIVSAFTTLRWIAQLLIMGLAISILTGLIHLARMNALFHRDAVSLMRLWGAGEGMIKTPGMISALSVGLLAGVLAWTGWWTLGQWLVVHVRALSPLLKEMPQGITTVGLALLASGVMMGGLAGFFGSGSGQQDERR